MRERIAAAQGFAGDLVELRELRLEGWNKLLYISRYLVAMSLPYRPITDRQITKSARFGDGSRVHLQLSAAVPGIDLPFGSDRTLLHWLLDRVARQIRLASKNGDSPALAALEVARFVRIESAADYLREMGLSASGKNYADLRERYRRVAGLGIGLRIEGAAGETIANIPLIERARLPRSLDRCGDFSEQQLQGESRELPFGVLFSCQLVATLIEDAVPFPQEILRRTRKKSQLQDYWVFLSWRSYAAEHPSVIPWGEVREQLWQQDQNTRRIRHLFQEAITALRVFWPELRAEARRNGLWIAPPEGRAYLIGDGAGMKRSPRSRG
jgi:hypothetical protein